MAELPLLGDGSEARGWRELGPDLPCWEGEAERRQQMEFGVYKDEDELSGKKQTTNNQNN